MDKSIQDILATIDDAITNFQGGIPEIQRQMMDELIPIIKEFDVRGGRLLNNVQNLRLLGTLQNKLKAIILNKKYKKAVENFTDSYTDLASLQLQYFAQFNKKFTPAKTLPIVKEQAVMQTINDLVGQGMNQLVVGSVEEILRQNITTGGSYKNLQTELEDHILDNYKGQGVLTKYTKQITTDAINQYNAQYHETIAQDLQFNWGRYVGSLITTSREFCIYLTKKDYFHKSELPQILLGHIDGHQCKLSKTTGIPYGMIPGTNPDNFKVRRGGYLCGHQVYWVPDSAVPKDLRDKFAGKPADPVPQPPPPVKPSTAEAVKSGNKKMLDEFKKKGYKIDDDLFDKLGEEITFAKSRKQTAYYQPGNNQVVIGAVGKRAEASKYFRDSLFPHEIGHAIHNTKKIIAGGKVDESFKTHFEDLQSVIKGKEKSIEEMIMTRRKAGMTHDQREQMGTIADILGSLTRGQYGYGHTKAYYRMATKPEAEIFAHGISLEKTGNEFVDLTPEMAEVIAKMIAYAKTI